MKRVASGEGWWAAITDNGAVLRSRDGRAWESWRPPHETSGTRGVDLYGVAVGSGTIVAVGRQLSFNRSVVAVWPLNSASGPKPKYYVAPDRLHAVDFSRGLFTAVGDAGTVLDVAPDGTATRLATISPDKSLRGVAFGGPSGRYVVAEVQASQLWTSTNRVAWQPVAVPGGQVGWVDVRHVGDRFLAVGESGVIAWSTNGTSWGRVEPVGATGLTGAGGGAGRVFVTSGSGRVWTGRDPRALSGLALPDPRAAHGAAYDGNRFLIVGAGGAGWFSGIHRDFDVIRLGRGPATVRLDFVAAHGLRYQLRKSTDLERWEILQDVVGRGYRVEVEDAEHGPGHQFYDLRLVP